MLVQVHAAGLDRGVWHVMRGLPYAARLAFGLRRPKHPVLGFDVAGTVIAVGRSVTRFAEGDEVYGFGEGTFAEYATVPEGNLARKPTNLSFERSAIVPVSAVTALKGLRSAGKLRAGQHVLITGASGGVGSYAVQLAKALGAEVTAVASTTKLELVRSLGADHVLDYTYEDFADGARHYDLILDIAGSPSIARLRRALTPNGTAVIAGGEDGGKLTGMSRQLSALAISPFARQRLTSFVGSVRTVDLEQLTAYIEAGTVTPSLDRTYPLEQTADAMRRLDAGEVRGKVAITI
ncbi:NAD(P)-dependent alcohol dehydrogenase [Pseudactinotalea suaedae]|uniref:NAD(P)-dependent alcohol dehydrogenase n=1 Tax=Pseudactinotalea suaedae TaxID=1524924 RepID=UPI001F4F4F50|nr:NAD(P)-dependent alcohol dehydrogenase [Pseudactinotalea suaedae]